MLRGRCASAENHEGLRDGQAVDVPGAAQILDLTGLSLRLRSSQDVRLDSPEPD
jgi:hypothetical protein